MQSEDLNLTPLRHPLDMIIHVQPWMLLAIIPILTVVEGPEISIQSLLSFQNNFNPVLVLLLTFIGGCLAFLMEFAEYLLLVNTSGITLSILGIVKETITLLLAHYFNGDTFSHVNTIGLIICISGMLIHSMTRRNPKTTSLRMESLCSPNSRRHDQTKFHILNEQVA